MELETSDPLIALKDKKSIHTRCAAARDLSRIGDVSAMPALAERSAEDRSPAVRLCAAGAAADILSRHRAARSLPESSRRSVLDLFKRVDPSLNPGLFPVLACLDLPASFQRIASGLRDPRGDVRVGAGVGLLRLCTSVAYLGDAALEEQVTGLLTDRRLKPDALAEVAKVCAAGGYTSALPLLEGLDLGESAHTEVVTSYRDIIGQLDGPATGLWWSDGRDAGEVSAEPPLQPGIRAGAPDGSAAVFVQGAGWSDVPAAQPARRMWFRRVGKAEAGHAFQVSGRTWYQVEPDEVSALLDEALAVEAVDWSPAAAAQPGAAALRGVLEAGLGDAAADLRLRALLRQRAGDAEGARADLEAAVERKKLPPDTWFFLGEARHLAGDDAGAREAWALAEKKAKRKKDWFVARARARLG